jgi:hypothetical protein
MDCVICKKNILNSEQVVGMLNNLCFKHCVAYVRKTKSKNKKQIMINWFSNMLLYKKLYPVKIYN